MGQDCAIPAPKRHISIENTITSGGRTVPGRFSSPLAQIRKADRQTGTDHDKGESQLTINDVN
jgi:hypothetical protein